MSAVMPLVWNDALAAVESLLKAALIVYSQLVFFFDMMRCSFTQVSITRCDRCCILYYLNLKSDRHNWNIIRSVCVCMCVLNTDWPLQPSVLADLELQGTGEQSNPSYGAARLARLDPGGTLRLCAPPWIPQLLHIWYPQMWVWGEQSPSAANTCWPPREPAEFI